MRIAFCGRANSVSLIILREIINLLKKKVTPLIMVKLITDSVFKIISLNSKALKFLVELNKEDNLAEENLKLCKFKLKLPLK